MSTDSCLNQNYKLCPELQKQVDSIKKPTMQSMKITVKKIDIYLENIYKLNPSLRPRKEQL